MFMLIEIFIFAGNVMRSHLSFGGNAVTLQGITFLDILNGCFVLVYAVETAEGVFFQGL